MSRIPRLHEMMKIIRIKMRMKMTMTMKTEHALVILLTALWALPAFGAGRIVEAEYPPSEKAGELVYGVIFRAWIPDGVTRLRGVIVHQHGCGKGAGQGGRRPPTTSTGRRSPGSGAAPCWGPRTTRRMGRIAASGATPAMAPAPGFSRPWATWRKSPVIPSWRPSPGVSGAIPAAPSGPA